MNEQAGKLAKQMPVEEIPSIGISYTVELPGKKALVLQSFVSRDAPVADLNGVLDKVRVAADRQFAFGAMQQIKLGIEQETKNLSDYRRNLAIVDENVKRNWERSNRKGDPKLSAAEETAQRQAFTNIRAGEERIAKLKADLADYEAMIQG